ncbi:MAG: hypothetical protein E6916_11575 [Clostridium cochlearium]|uniref:hypothetical protein n=1 Tax=Clostridium cochlearium TaxID=1494 RepID=UPI00280AEC0A|nr:hypothetical protein [Clostridium cochlearium]MDU1444129.1 hypothetical protein [Clostridium cochlearium]
MGHYEEEHIEIIKYLVDTSKTLIKAVDYIERNLYGFKDQRDFRNLRRRNRIYESL